MENLKQTLINTWRGIVEPISELCIYLALAFIIQKLFSITYMQGISIVFTFFALSLLREGLAALVRGR